MNKSHLFVAAAIVQIISAADPCQELCAAHPDFCGTEGSFCMGGDEDECFDLYWTDASRRDLTNATKKKCALEFPLRCSDARRYLLTGGSSALSSAVRNISPFDFQSLPIASFEPPSASGGDMDLFADMLADMPQFPDLVVARPSSRASSKRSSDSSDSDGEDGELFSRKRARQISSTAEPVSAEVVDLTAGEATEVETSPPQAADPAVAEDLAAIASLLTLRRSQSTETVTMESLEAKKAVAEDDDFVLIDFGTDGVKESGAEPTGHMLGHATNSRHLSSLARWRMANQFRPPTPRTVRIDPHYFKPVGEAAWTDAELDRVLGSGANWSPLTDHDSSDTWDIFADSHQPIATSRRRVVPVAGSAGVPAAVARRGTPGVRGVSNLGFTCYFGATLQLLSHSRRFREYLESHPSVQPNALETQLRAFMARMWAPENEEGAIRPIEVFQALSAINPGEFVVGRMSDAHEALMAILDQVAESMKPQDAPFHARTSLDSLLAIQDATRLSCTGCGRISETRVPGFEIFLNIPEVAAGTESVAPAANPAVTTLVDTADGFLSMDEAAALLGMATETVVVAPVDGSSETNKENAQPVVVAPRPRHVTLNECFAAYATQETIGEYACERCAPTRHDGHQVHRITSTSDIVTIALRRFTWEDMKISTPVEIPLTLNMSEVPGSEVDALYRLVGVVNHFGATRNGGHYTAVVHNSAENRWVHMDDSASEHVDDFGTRDSFRSEHAYILMYERVDALDAVQPESVAATVEAESSTPLPSTETTTTL